MSIHLSTNGPPPRRLRRLIVSTAGLLGATLMTVMALSAVPMLWIGLVGGAQIVAGITGDDAGGPLGDVSPSGRRSLAVVWVASVAVFLVARYAGRRLLAVGRHRVLFLRRSDQVDSTRAVTFAASRLGPHWRHIALDGGPIGPVGVTPGARAMSRSWHTGSRIAAAASVTFKAALVILLALAAGMAVAALVLFGLADGGLDQRIDAVRAAGQSGGGPAGAVLRFLLGAVVAAVLVLGSDAAVLIPALFLLLVPVWWVFGSAMESVSRAEGSKVLTVGDTRDIPDRRRTLTDLTGRLFGARLIVLKATDQIWQATVAALAADTSVALFDLSEPSDNVLWEVELLTTRVPQPCVFVAERSRAELLVRAAATDPALAGLADALDGRPILIYTTDGKGIRRFTRELRASLEHAVADRVPRPSIASSMTSSTTSLTAVVAVAVEGRPQAHDWHTPWVDADGRPELAPDEEQLFAFDAAWFREERDRAPMWYLRSPLRVFVTTERTIWISMRPGAGTVVAGHMRHIWVHTVFHHHPRRWHRGDNSVGLMALWYGQPRVGGSVEFGVRRGGSVARRLLTVAVARSAKAWSLVVPREYQRRAGERRFVRHGGIAVAGTGTPTFIGTHIEALPPDDPDRLTHFSHPDGPPAGYRGYRGDLTDPKGNAYE